MKGIKYLTTTSDLLGFQRSAVSNMPTSGFPPLGTMDLPPPEKHASSATKTLAGDFSTQASPWF